ncbi:carbohydrate ABC transporter permease, partial [Rhizobium johnstonii]
CYALTLFDLAGKESIFFWTITNLMAPPAVFLLPLFLLLTQVYNIGDFSLADSKLVMILVYCSFNLPFAIWTLRPTLEGIPKELDE